MKCGRTGSGFMRLSLVCSAVPAESGCTHLPVNCLLVLSVILISLMVHTEVAEMKPGDFNGFTNVTITGLDPDTLKGPEREVLCQAARYCQAMTEADIATMREIVSEDMTFTHMSGMKQTREEYFADVADVSLTYYSIGIENPVIEVDGDQASVTYTAVLNADAYGARGTFRMRGTHHYQKRNGQWIAVNP